MLEGRILLFGGPAAGKTDAAKGIEIGMSELLLDEYLENFNVDKKTKKLLYRWFYNYLREKRLNNPLVPFAEEYKQLDKKHLNSLEEAFDKKLFNLETVSMGDILRNIKDELTVEEQKKMDSGKLVSDHYINENTIKPLLKKKKFRNFILDGYPRTENQLTYILNLINQYDKENNINSERPIDFGVHVIIEKEIAKQRTIGRRACPKPEHHHLQYNLSSKDYEVKNQFMSERGYLTGLCTECGSELIVRKDDTPENFEEKRWPNYIEQTLPIIGKLKAKGIPLIDIPGGMPIDKVISRFSSEATRYKAK